MESVRLVASSLTMLKNIEGLPSESDKVRSIHNWVSNNIRWSSDKEMYNVEDYWATPYETLKKERGDCEDIAILKYFLMLKAGVSVGTLRISFVKMLQQGKQLAHMVLCYYDDPEDDSFVSDCINPKLLRFNERADLTLVYGFNHDNLWVGNSKMPAGVNPEQALKTWKDVRARMSEEIEDNKWY